uniref:Uncharacterized protein n=1 Tax=Meloidogyne enterolobii TaxID=390850 RepID=A0A6V7Y6Z2_MELEN|nr:unnamed protein product [Meloidogyne enterolobii]
MKEKIQKLESEHKNEIEELKQNSKQNSKQKIVLQSETENEIFCQVNNQKDEKINSLEKQIKEANNLFEKKIADLSIKLERVNFLTCKVVSFVEFKNKWKYIYKPIGNCIEGNGYVNLISDENIKYINCVEGKGEDIQVVVQAENSFKRPQNCINFSLFYFEIKCKMEKELNKCWMVIGLKDCQNKSFKFLPKNGTFMKDNLNFKLPTFSWNDNDVFGCGLVYPPTDKKTRCSYIFFTQNGKRIGKALLLKKKSDYYYPYVVLQNCSVEANFGNNLETNPFIYDVKYHQLEFREFY